jgi:regulator of protease activity HflC (stomatin/prohibitin superfamily)
MSGWLTFAIVVLVITLVALAVAWFSKPTPPIDPDDRYIRAETPFPVRAVALVVAAVFGVVTVFSLVMSSVEMVGTKKVGIVLTFNKPTRVLENGLHVITPGQRVVEYDKAIQTLRKTGDNDSYDVRIANQARAKADVIVRWQIESKAALDLYRDYKDFGNVRKNLVEPAIKAALNNVLATYDPLIAAKTEDRNTAEQFGLDKVADDVRTELVKRVGKQIIIKSVTVPMLRFDGATEDAIKEYQKAVANTRVAEQKERTAEAEARANQKLSESLRNDPNVLTSKCLDIVREKGVVAGFSCFPGGGAPVIVGQK